MSYTLREQSDYTGQPLELYRFSLGGKQWLYTSAAHAVSGPDGDIYQPVYIKRGGYTKDGTADKATLDVEVNAQNDVALLFRSGWLTGVLVLTIYRHHRNDSEFALFWKGRVTGCRWAGSVATLTSDSAFTLFQRAGLRRMYQVGCPHVLYSTECGVDAASWKHDGTVVDVTSNEVEVSGAGTFGDGWFVGGMFQAGDDLRLITAHSGDVVTLVDFVEGIAAGSTVALWPGCAHTVAACRNKFNNIINYGGLPFLPSKNPFSGDALV